MKNSFLQYALFLISVFALVFSFSGCGSGDDPAPLVEEPQSAISVTTDGETWKAGGEAITFSFGSPILMVVNETNGSRAMTISTDAGIDQSGNYALTGETSLSLFSTNGRYSLVSGEMTITLYDLADKKLSGSISATLINVDDESDEIQLEMSFENVDFRIPVQSGNTLSAEINNVPYVSSNVIAYTLGSINISATLDNGELIAVSTTKIIPVGSHEMAFPSDHIRNAYIVTDSEIYFVEQGTFIVSKHDQELRILEGSFDFTASNLDETETRSVTNGLFAVRY